MIKAFICFIFFIALIVSVSYAEINKTNNITNVMVTIPAGKFKMGCNQFGPMNGAPEHFVYLRSFMIDMYEVTNRKYEEVIPDHKTRRSVLSNCDDCPVTNVSWYGSADYCYLIGKSLPTEAQWERAAGNKDGCAFPWGYGFNPLANQASGGLNLRDKSKPVGSFPPNTNGIYDMAGNVWEWVSDWMAPGYQSKELRINPRGPNSGIMKVRRGGSYSDSIQAMATGYRDWSYPSSRYFSDVGFRCVINIVRKSSDGFKGQN